MHYQTAIYILHTIPINNAPFTVYQVWNSSFIYNSKAVILLGSNVISVFEDDLRLQLNSMLWFCNSTVPTALIIGGLPEFKYGLLSI